MSDHSIEYLLYLSSFILTMWACNHCVKYMCPRRKTRTNVKRFIKKNLSYLNMRGSDLISNINGRTGINVFKVYDKTKQGTKLLMYQSISMIMPFLDGCTRLCLQVNRFHNKHYAMHRKTRKNEFKRRQLILFMALSKARTRSEVRQTPLRVGFDIDSFNIGLDQHSSRCISNTRTHFVKLQTSKHKGILGTGGNANIEGEGTLQWRIEDDQGATHKFLIPHSLYVPSSPKCLLSPQHLAQVGPKEHRHTTGCDQQWDRAILRWGPDGKFRRTVMNSRETNTPNITTASNIETYLSHVKRTNKNEEFYQTCIECCQSTAHIIPDDESIEASSSSNQHTNSLLSSPDQVNDEISIGDTTMHQPKGSNISEYREENLTDFNTTDEQEVNKELHIIESDEEALSANTPYAELLRWHYRLGHISFVKLKAMARMGILPKRLANVQHIKCKACQFGKMTKKPWRSKSQPKGIYPVTKPGQCVSVDQMMSSTVGFVAQLKVLLREDIV